MRKENEAHEHEERKALEAAYQRDIEHEALKLKAELAELRFELVMAEFRRKAKFNPNQPRVSAGSPDGGQWTEGGADNDDRPSDAASDEQNGSSPQLVQDNTDRLLNRHIIQNHVAKTDEELKARIQARQYPGLFVRIGMDRNGSFDSIESARDFINQTIANNPGEVARVTSGELRDSFLTWRFGYHTGREAIMDSPGSEIRMRPTYEVGVAIAHDPRSDFGYRVVNAFPRNFNPRTGR